jgi:hypothetical protein
MGLDQERNEEKQRDAGLGAGIADNPTAFEEALFSPQRSRRAQRKQCHHKVFPEHLRKHAMLF